jgi:hypothetical protein
MSEILPAGYVCWSTEGLELITGNVGDLGLGDEAILLASHSAMRCGIEVKEGDPKIASFLASHEDEGNKGVVDARIIEAFRIAVDDGVKKDSKNVLFAVVGAPGSGKSHLVRWMYQLVADSDDRYKKIWVPRSERAQYLVIRKFIESLEELGSDRSKELSAKLNETFRKSTESPIELVTDIYSSLSRQLKFDESLRDPIEKSERVIRRQLLGVVNSNESQGRVLWELLNDVQNAEMNGEFKDGLVAYMTRIVDSLRNSQNGLENSDEVKSEIPSEQIEKLLKQYEKFFRKRREDAYANLLMVGINDFEVVARILNAALENAIANVLNIEGGSIREVFSEVRTELAIAGKQLLIFVEDFSTISSSNAGLGRMQRDLMAMFTEQASSGDLPLAPLRVVMAVTKNTFSQMEDNFKDRLSFVVDVDQSTSDADEMLFLSSYLKLSRTNRQDLFDSWSESANVAHEGTDWVPNSCTSCTYREDCFETFKHTNGIGNYPLTPFAGSRIAAGSEGTPRERIQRLKNLLIGAQNDLPKTNYPSNASSKHFGISGTEIDRLNSISFKQPLSDENDKEYQRLRRYVLNWSNSAWPTLAEMRVFGFRDFGGISQGSIEAGPLQKVEGIGVGASQVVKHSPFKENVTRINNWRSAEEGADVRKLLTNTLESELKTMLLRQVKVAFSRQLVGASFETYEKHLGLKLSQASFRIEGMTVLSVDRQNPLDLYFDVPRNTYGMNLLLGALYVDSVSKDKQGFELPVDQQLSALTAFRNFTQGCINHAVEVIHKVEGEVGEIWDVGAKALRFVSQTTPELQSLTTEELVGLYLKGELRLEETGELSLMVRKLCESTNSLKAVLNSLAQVHQGESENDSPPYRLILRLVNSFNALSESPSEYVKSLQLPADSRGEWKVSISNLFTEIFNRYTSDQAVENIGSMIDSKFRLLSASITNDTSSELENLKERVNTYLGKGAFNGRLEDIELAIKEVRDYSSNWQEHEKKFSSVLKTGIDADWVLNNSSEFEYLNELSEQVEFLLKQLDRAVRELADRSAAPPEIQVSSPRDVADLSNRGTFEGGEND